MQFPLVLALVLPAAAQPGEHSGAAADSNPAIRLNTNDTQACLDRGAAKERSGDWAGAAADYTEVIRLRPTNAFARFKRGWARAHQGDQPGAIVDYTESIRLQPTNAVCYLDRGVARARLGDKEAALADYTAAIDQNPNYLLAYQNRAKLRASMGDATGAKNDTETAAGIQERVAFAAFQSQARAWRNLTVKPPLPDLVKQDRALAEEALQHQDYQAALNYFEKGLATDPTWYQGQYNAASLSGDYLQKYTAALSHMKRYLELLPDAPNAAAVRQQMALWQAKAQAGTTAGKPAQTTSPQANPATTPSRPTLGGLQLK